MLGGVEMSLRLRDHLALAFNSMKKSKNDVRRNVRSMAKLFKESNRVKHVLSANADHHAQVRLRVLGVESRVGVGVVSIEDRVVREVSECLNRVKSG